MAGPPVEYDPAAAGGGGSAWNWLGPAMEFAGNLFGGGGGSGGSEGQPSDQAYIWKNIQHYYPELWETLVGSQATFQQRQIGRQDRAASLGIEGMYQGVKAGQLANVGTQQRQEYGGQFWDRLQNEYRTPAVSGQDLNRMTGYNLRQTEPTMRSNMAVTGRALGLESPSGQRSMMGQQTRMDEDARFRATNWATERNQRKQMELLSRMTGVQGFY